ncbi:hypothetical protein ES706_04798 [subsurface metagenome]
MDIGEIFVKVFNIGHSIYNAERTRRGANQRSSELKELSGKIAPELGKTGKYHSQAEKTEPAASEGLVEAKDQGPPETTNELSRNIPQEKPSEEIPRDIATACVNCAIGHFSGAAKLLNEAFRFRDDGIESDQVLDDIAGAIGELNAMERVDLTPERLQKTPGWERTIAEEALRESRKLRHRLEGISSIEDIEKAAADTEGYYKRLNRQWYRGRFAHLGAKAEVIARRVGG